MILLLQDSGAGVVTIEGVEVTTNTATQTLSNKTLAATPTHRHKYIWRCKWCKYKSRCNTQLKMAALQVMLISTVKVVMHTIQDYKVST